MSALPKYHASIQPDWIDFNGHVRDAYYTLVASYAIDEFMDQVGLDAGYRARTQCTLYTLELHIHYLREVKQSDDLSVLSQVLDVDKKRIHLASRMECTRLGPEAAATVDFMLMHVHQGEQVRAAQFPDEVLARLHELKAKGASEVPFGPLSRAIAIKRS